MSSALEVKWVYCVYLLLHLWCSVAQIDGFSNCQSSYRHANDTRIGYPLFYFRDAIDRVAPTVDVASEPCEVQPCLDSDDSSSTEIDYCPVRPSPAFSGDCPISQTFVDGALSGMPWPHLSKGLCGLHKLNKEASGAVVKVIYFGGSMTDGACTEQHCCCTKDNEGCNSGPGYSCGRALGRGILNACGWTSHFSNALLSLFPGIEFVFRRLTGSGWTAAYMGEELLNLLHEKRVGPLTSDDIVVLDFSTNDGRDICAGAHPEVVRCRLGLESLIRRIYFYANISLPSILLIEQYPPLDCWGNRYNYSTVYRNTARHYNLPLLSYPAALFAVEEKGKQPYLVGRLRDFGQYLHPAWHVHLLLSDLFSAALQKMLSPCREADEAQFSHQFSSYASIPKPLNHYSTAIHNDVCDPRDGYVLNYRANSTLKPSNLSEWEDAHGDWGWREYYDVHNPGIIINKHSDPARRVLRFQLPADTHVTYINIVYLQTYKNAGRVKVRLCGEYVDNDYHHVIDALSKNHRHDKSSVPRQFPVKVRYEEEERCLAANDTTRSLELEYEVIEKSDINIRHDQKVKIFRVQVCSRIITE